MGTDRAPVGEPSSVFLIARVSRSQVDGLPESQAETVARPLSLLGHGCADGWPPPELLAPDVPTDIVMSASSAEALLTRGPDLVVSVALTSLDQAVVSARARESETRVERRGPGIYVIEPDGYASPPCWLMASVGPSPARLLCGSSPAALEALANYAARSLPTRDLGSEPLSISVWPTRLGAKLGPSARVLAPAVVRAVGGSSPALIGAALPDLVSDAIDALADVETLRLSYGPESEGAVLRITADVRGSSSWLARALASYGARGGGARDLFGRLPLDTELGWFSSGPDPVRTGEARGAFVGWMKKAFGPGTDPATLDLVARTFLPDAPYVYAQGDGHGVDATTGPGGRALWEKTLSTYGWHLMGYDEPLKEYLPKLDAGMKAYNAGDLRNLAYRELPSLCPGLGKITKRAAPRVLPAGSMLYELRLPGKFFDDCSRQQGKGPAAPNETLAVVAVADGSRTWIGLGLRPDALMSRIAAVVKRAPGTGIGTEPDLEPLRVEGVRMGGYATLAGLGGLLRFLTMQEHWEWRRSRLAGLPNRGTTRVPFTLSVTGSGATLYVRIPRKALEDMAAFRSAPY